MKLVWVNDKESAESYLPSCRLAVETALVRRGTPLFLPGWSERWVGQVGIGVVIDRLGRHIDQKFTHRYYNKCVFVVNAYPEDSEQIDRCCRESVFSMDGSILVSEVIDVQRVQDVCDKMGFIKPDGLNEFLDSVVSHASKVFTLHTGDVVVGGDLGSLDLIPDTRITFTLDDTIILNHKIK